jgi:hypothetical protein
VRCLRASESRPGVLWLRRWSTALARRSRCRSGYRVVRWSGANEASAPTCSGR